MVKLCALQSDRFDEDNLTKGELLFVKQGSLTGYQGYTRSVFHF